jgi:4'-phosphopantetheinyl transferase
MDSRAEVHVYYATADRLTPDAVARDFALLQPDERERAARFRFDADRRMYVGAHGLLRRSLSRHGGAAPAEWRFSGKEGDRPEIAAPLGSPRLRFSLSHTRSVVACAIATELDVGIDVEDLTRDAPLEVSERFALSERTALAALGPGAREDLFFAYWTLKEAYIKARGLGLAIPLDEMAFDVSPSKIEVSFRAGSLDDESEWRFESWRIGDTCRAAIAVRSRQDLQVLRSTG